MLTKGVIGNRAAEETEMTIIVRITNNYGNRAVYPVCETAKKFAEMIGTKTFTHRALGQIEALGYSISLEAQSL